MACFSIKQHIYPVREILMSNSITCTVDEFPSGDGEFLSAWQVGEALLLPHRRGLKPEDLEMSIELKYTSDEYPSDGLKTPRKI